MKIDYPQQEHIPALRQLWQQAFGDDDTFLDGFFSTAYAPDRCRCVTEAGAVLAAGYWLDCEYDGRRLAYLYALATDGTHRGRGLATALLADMEEILSARGYAGILLCPGNVPLFDFYRARGFEICSYVNQETVIDAGSPLAMAPIGPAEFAAQRRTLLPAGAVLQEGATLEFLDTFQQFYRGDGFLLTARVEAGRVFVTELLGDCRDLTGIPGFFGVETGVIRCPGAQLPFAMYRPLSDAPAPQYLGLALD